MKKWNGSLLEFRSELANPRYGRSCAKDRQAPLPLLQPPTVTGHQAVGANLNTLKGVLTT